MGPICVLYGSRFCFKTKCICCYDIIYNASCNVMPQLAEFMEPYKDAFHSLYRLIVIALTIPVSTASCERSFSIMRQIKSYLRNSMGEERLSNLAVLSIESKRAKGLDMDLVVDEFDGRHQNRRITLH